MSWNENLVAGEKNLTTLTDKFDIQAELEEAYSQALSQADLVLAAQMALVAEGLGGQPIGLSIEVADDEYVQRLNREYRGIDRTTDVLSFANEEAPDWDGRPGVVYGLQPQAADADESLDEETLDPDEYDDEADDGGRPGFILPPELAESADGSRYLGDIVVSFPQAERQASEFNNTVGREVQELIIHGVFHLLGYDHEEPDDREIMRAKEEAAARLLDQAVQV